MSDYPKVKLCRYRASGICWWCEGQARRWLLVAGRLRRTPRNDKCCRADFVAEPARNDEEPESCFALQGSFGLEGPQDDIGM
jgi:hypothetical protein